MFMKLFRGTEWSDLAPYLSSSFFDVVSPGAILGQIQVLLGQLTSKKGLPEVVAEVNDLLLQAGKEMRVVMEKAPIAEGVSLSPEIRAELLLDLYFLQVMGLKSMVLDFRESRFCQNGNFWVWSPRALFIRWDPDFLLEIRKLYLGFYRRDDLLFNEAALHLGLEGAEGALRDHFGSNQSAVKFTLEDFRSSFHQIFQAAKKTKRKIHPNFMALGAGLVCLYEHLEALGCVCDVRASFFRAIEVVDQIHHAKIPNRV